MDEITNIIDTVEDVADKFSSQIGSTEKRLLDEVLNLVKELNVTNGRINSSVENLKLLSTIKTKLKQAVLNKEYLQGVKELIKGIDRIMNVQTSYFNKAFTVGKDFKAKSKLAKQLAVDDTVEMLAGAGMEANVTSRINEMLLRSITSGGKYADLVRDMSDFLTTNENGEGALSKYAQTWVNTSLSRFAGQNNKLMTDDLGLEWFMYVGSNKDTTREFCEHLVKKKYVHKSEIPDIVNGLIDGHQCEIYERTGLPKGMIDGTTADNFQANCGGWNCGHQLVQVNKVAVPKDVLDKFEYPQKEGVVGKAEFEPLAVKGAVFFDPLQVNSFLKMVDVFREKVPNHLRKKGFENMLKNEQYQQEGDVYVMNGAKPNKTELHTAQKLNKGGYIVVFPNDGQIKGIKKIENSTDTRKNDVYIYNKSDYKQSKVDLKTVNSGSRETIAKHIIGGSGQAPVIVLDVQGGTTRWNLIKGIRDGWGTDTKKIIVNWKGQWYEMDKKKVFDDVWFQRNLK